MGKGLLHVSLNLRGRFEEGDALRAAEGPVVRAHLREPADLQSRSRLVLPAQRLPVELAAIERSESDNPSKPLVRRKTKGDVERHPVPDKKQAVNQIGVPAQFPAEATISGSRGSLLVTQSGATAAIPASPSRDTRASICCSLTGGGIGISSIDATEQASIAIPATAGSGPERAGGFEQA